MDTPPDPIPEQWRDYRAAELDLIELVLFTADPQLWLDIFMSDDDLVSRMLQDVEADGMSLD